MATSLSSLPGASQGIYFVENYLEAAGVLAALRSGIDLASVRRPIHPTKVTVEADA
jgi:hypothetical protein